MNVAGESLHTSFLTPYLDSLTGSKFTNGSNFAIVGSSTLPEFVPFALNVQTMQFIHFKQRILENIATGTPPLYLLALICLSTPYSHSPWRGMLLLYMCCACIEVSHKRFAGSGITIDQNDFQTALYMIDIGQNDLANSFAKNLTYAEVVRTIPSVITEIKNAIKVIRITCRGQRISLIHPASATTKRKSHWNCGFLMISVPLTF